MVWSELPAAISKYIDGGWFDIVTFVIAVLVSAFKCYLQRQPFISQQTGRNLLHGIAVFPLLVLALSVFSNEILQSLLQSSRVILSAAGAVALFSILEDEFKKNERA